MLGSCWDDFGIMLGSCWDHFGIILGSFWHHEKIIVGSSWDHQGQTLQIFLHIFCVFFNLLLAYFYESVRPIEEDHLLVQEADLFLDPEEDLLLDRE